MGGDEFLYLGLPHTVVAPPPSAPPGSSISLSSSTVAASLRERKVIEDVGKGGGRFGGLVGSREVLLYPSSILLYCLKLTQFEQCVAT
jgi:hypothetical protein